MKTSLEVPRVGKKVEKLFKGSLCVFQKEKRNEGNKQKIAW